MHKELNLIYIRLKLIFTILGLLVGSISAYSSELKYTSISKITDSIALSHKGNEIEVVQYKSDTNKLPNNKFLIQGGLHGNEVLTSRFVEWLIDRVSKNKSLLNQIENIEIDFVAIANPDAHGKSRLNSNSVNLNRNFGVLWGMSKEPPGESAFSEAETKAVRKLFNDRKYLSAMDVHGYVNWVVLPTRLSKNKLKYNKWITETRKNIKYLPGKYHIKFAGDLGDGGAFEDWAYWSQGSLASCLEMKYRRRFLKNKPDTFLAYERFVYESFKSAIKIKKSRFRKSISLDSSDNKDKYQSHIKKVELSSTFLFIPNFLHGSLE